MLSATNAKSPFCSSNSAVTLHGVACVNYIHLRVSEVNRLGRLLVGTVTLCTVVTVFTSTSVLSCNRVSATASTVTSFARVSRHNFAVAPFIRPSKFFASAIASASKSNCLSLVGLSPYCSAFCKSSCSFLVETAV